MRLAAFGEAGGEEVDRAHALLDGLVDELLDGARGHARDHVVDGAGGVEQVRVAGEAADLVDVRVDEVEGLLLVEALLHEREQEATAARAAHVARGADDGDRAWVEDRFERVLARRVAHGASLSLRAASIVARASRVGSPGERADARVSAGALHDPARASAAEGPPDGRALLPRRKSRAARTVRRCWMRC